jgi:transposase
MGRCPCARLPLTAILIAQARQASEGIDGLSAAMRGLVMARVAVLSAVAAIDADIKKLARASNACRRLMTIPGVGHLTTLAFTAAVHDSERFRRSRDLGAYLGLVAINPARSTTPAASPSAATGECEPCFTKLRTSC